MTLKTETELNTDFADGQFRANSAARIRNLIDSKFAVAGTMYATDETFNVTTAWGVFNVFTASIDTKGVTEDLVNGRFTVGAGAGGTWAVDFQASTTSIVTGWVEVALTKNGALTPYRSRRRVDDTDGSFSIPATGNLAVGDTFGVAIRGQGNATITVNSAQLRGIRV